MAGNAPEWDYVFISDLHLSLGYDPVQRAYHPREDFFFDDAFYRWLQWLDGQCAEGRRWELVFAGDAFDFFPVDTPTVAEYFAELDRRRKQVNLADHWQVVQYWERQFDPALQEQRAPEHIQRLVFEDDVLDGRIRLSVAPPGDASKSPAEGLLIPAWAIQLYERYWPPAGTIVRAADERLVLRAPTEDEVAAFRVAWHDSGLTARRAGRDPQGPARGRDAAFERRYGFLPTPEKSANKVQAIYRGHPVFFRALAWFAGRGHRIVFLRGNHDLELYWPSVQERIREVVALEYAGLEQASDAADLTARIVFQPGWFYYRRGLFYAEHGSQYEPLSACPNPIRPLLPANEWLLNPDVGSLGVVCLGNDLESAYPASENEAHFGAFLLGLIRRDPLKMVAFLTRHALGFVRMAGRLWLAGSGNTQELEPGKNDLAAYAVAVGLAPAVVGRIYRAEARPLLLQRTLAWILFSPWGHVTKALAALALAALALGGIAVWYLIVAPALAALVPANLLFASVGPALQLLAKILLWLVPPTAYALLRRWLHSQASAYSMPDVARRIHNCLREQDPQLAYLIVGHDHQPDARPIGQRADGPRIYYLNTGTWTPGFGEGVQRLRRLGRDVQFTFLQLVRRGEAFQAELLRWNDDAGRAERQMVLPGEG